ncbi:hypothetical protein GOP47_0008374 [Adiantum capillus-veneris]|uniref:Phosphoribulokinase, chloroplastic n=1 Tax=Adiantum capillus-veneris TaxID=13818 RepID=A0A9D4UYF4_ADICA|nr:hypothetical protein GOP47_0008374 [Adiantum capillus-veneris]
MGFCCVYLSGCGEYGRVLGKSKQEGGVEELKLAKKVLRGVEDNVESGQVGWAAVNSFGSTERRGSRVLTETRMSSGVPLLERLGEHVDEKSSGSLVHVRMVVLHYQYSLKKEEEMPLLKDGEEACGKAEAAVGRRECRGHACLHSTSCICWVIWMSLAMLLWLLSGPAWMHTGFKWNWSFPSSFKGSANIFMSHPHGAHGRSPGRCKFAWKIQRDMAEQGHNLESIKASIVAREPDFDAFIDAQKQYVDVVILVLHTQFVPDDVEGKVLHVLMIMKKSVPHFKPVHFFNQGSTISWVPCGQKLTCSYPGIKLFYGLDMYYDNEVTVLEMDGQFDKLEELIYVESRLSNISRKFYGGITQKILKHANYPNHGRIEDSSSLREHHWRGRILPLLIFICLPLFPQACTSTYMKNLQVISECKKLSMALKVIGASLCTNAHETFLAAYWGVARGKLQDLGGIP